MKTDTLTFRPAYRLKCLPQKDYIPHKAPPYNTGKLKIGCHYVPPQLNYNTETTDYWQDLYLGGHRAARRERLWMAAYVAAVAVGLCVGFWFFR
jgi:hypothetical protein